MKSRSIRKAVVASGLSCRYINLVDNHLLCHKANRKNIFKDSIQTFIKEHLNMIFRFRNKVDRETGHIKSIVQDKLCWCIGHLVIVPLRQYFRCTGPLMSMSVFHPVGYQPFCHKTFVFYEIALCYNVQCSLFWFQTHLSILVLIFRPLQFLLSFYSVDSCHHLSTYCSLPVDFVKRFCVLFQEVNHPYQPTRHITQCADVLPRRLGHLWQHLNTILGQWLMGNDQWMIGIESFVATTWIQELWNPHSAMIYGQKNGNNWTQWYIGNRL